jgi:hypothetical protein
MLQKLDKDRLDKVLKIIERHEMRFPVATLSKEMKVNKGNVSAYLKGNKAMSENFYNTFLEHYGGAIVDGPDSYQKQRAELKLNTDRRKVPFFDTEATATNISQDAAPVYLPEGSIDVGDLLNDSEAAIRIYGNSMLPNYPPGCVVGLVKITQSFIQPGEVYVIETTDGQRLLKRLFYKDDNPDNDSIACYSDNAMKFEGGSRNGKQAYPPFNIHKKDIIKLFIVTGVIKRNTNSIIIKRN